MFGFYDKRLIIEFRHKESFDYIRDNDKFWEKSAILRDGIGLFILLKQSNCLVFSRLEKIWYIIGSLRKARQYYE